MSDIADYTTNFFNEMVNYSITIPLQYKIYLLLIIIFILVELYYIIIKKIPVSSKYILWGMAFIILNIVNIIISSQIYLKKKGSYVGPPGIKGAKGEKGQEGENITCKLCDNNIYLQRSNRYDLKMNFAIDVFKMIYNNNYNFINIRNQLNNNAALDINSLITDIYNNNISGNMYGLIQLIDLQRYVLMYSILENVKKQYGKMVIKTAGRKRGFTPLSDIVAPDGELSESFVFNGDIRYPSAFKKQCSIYGLEGDGSKRKYNVYSLIGPDEYKGMGVVVIPADAKPVKSDYVCLNKSCIKPAVVQDLEIQNIYPDNKNGFVSFWKSQFNTLHINTGNSRDFKTRGGGEKKVIEIINDYNDDIYYNNGEVKREIYKQNENFLTKIKIDKLSALSYILSTYFEITKNELKLFNKKYTAKLGLKLGIYNNMIKKGNIKYNNISSLMEKITAELNAAETRINAKLIDKTAETVENIIEQEGGNDSKTLFHANRYFTMIRKTMDFIPVHIENCETLLDLVNYIFDYGLETNIDAKKITYQQKSLIYLIKCIMPPAIEVYIPKNSCLVYEQINEDRLKLIDDCENIIDEYNEIVAEINSQGDTSIYNNKERAELNKLVEIIKYKFGDNFSNIIDYTDKINKFEFREFTDTQLRTLFFEYKKVVDRMKEFGSN